MSLNLFTSESVSEGHPDKLADQISDAVLDACLTQDPGSRVACETLVGKNLIVLAGEISTKAQVDYESVAREVVRNVGYTSEAIGLNCETCRFLLNINEQSPDIALGVNSKGAGDQGLMFGYAINETQELMPLSIQLSHKITQRLSSLRKTNKTSFLLPDSKSQVSIAYKKGGELESIYSVVVSTQHIDGVNDEELKKFVREEVINPVIPEELLSADVQYWINPTSRFVVEGTQGDVGLTGRKIIFDTYGGHGSHGGGAFSGKDPSKVDRSACFAIRHIAKNIVASEVAERCLVQVAYAIGQVDPVRLYLNTYGTSQVSEEALVTAVLSCWDLSPEGIIQHYNLLNPIYSSTATYGHFGRSEFSWEKLDKVEALKSALS